MDWKPAGYRGAVRSGKWWADNLREDLKTMRVTKKKSRGNAGMKEHGGEGQNLGCRTNKEEKKVYGHQ